MFYGVENEFVLSFRVKIYLIMFNDVENDINAHSQLAPSFKCTMILVLGPSLR